MAELAKKKKDQESDQSTVYLRPKDRDTKPWYSDRDLRRYEDMEDGEQAEERRARDKYVRLPQTLSSPSCPGALPSDIARA